MRLYLVQHAAAKPKEDDPDRPLSAQGRVDIDRMATFLARNDVALESIRHSGKTRAAQTADVLSDRLQPVAGVSAVEGLKPLDDPMPWAERLKGEQDNLMLVGHLPFVARLAALLVAGDPNVEVVRFQPGGVLCLERDDAGAWAIAWLVVPSLLG